MIENKIVDLLRCRDQKGMTEFLIHYTPLIKYIVSPILNNDCDIDECVSEVAMRVWDKIGQYDESRGNFKTWLTAISRNTALNKIRQNHDFFTENDISDEAPSPDPSPEALLLREEALRDLRGVIKKLSKKEVILIYRRYYYMQSVRQIASELGTTERAVEGRLYRIKKRIKNLLGGEI